MKSQMRFQKILMLLTLIVGALGVVYALVFSSGVFNQVIQVADPSTAGSEEFRDKIQAVNDALLILGVVLVVISVLPYVMGCHNRRNYYITNYIAIGVVIVFQIVYVILLFVNISQAMAAFNAVDLEDAKEWYGTLLLADRFGQWEDSPWTVTVGYIYAIIIVINAVVLALNAVWKTALMKGEKALLRQGNVKEVA